MPISPSCCPHSARLSARLSAQPFRALPSTSPPPCPRPPGWAGRNAATPPPRSAGEVGEFSEPGEARAEWRGWRRGWGAAVAPLYRETSEAKWGYEGVVGMVGGKSGGSTTSLPSEAAPRCSARHGARKKGHAARQRSRPQSCGYALQM